MAEQASKTRLYFIKSPKHDLAAIELFLSKRDYQIFTESDLIRALGQIEKIKPHFIFIAFDHTDSNILEIPNAIYQISNGIIIPFSIATTREEINKLDQSQFEHKLYPPLSGPAIQRVLAKISKTVELIDETMFFKSDSNTKQISPTTDEPVSTSPEINKQIRDQFATFATQDNKNELPSLSKNEKKLSQAQKNNLENSFQKQIKPDLIDFIDSQQQSQTSSLHLFETSSIHVIIIQEKSWTGYLTVASENQLDYSLAKVILDHWIKDNLGSDKINIETVLMKLDIPTINFGQFCDLKSDFSQSFDHEGYKTILAFFSFSPFEVLNTPTENFNYIEVPVEFLKPKTNLPFEVCLFLPENNKFLNYIRLGSTMGDTQIYRLHARNISHVYSPFQYSQALLQYKAEFNMHSLIESYHLVIKPNPGVS